MAGGHRSSPLWSLPVEPPVLCASRPIPLIAFASSTTTTPCLCTSATKTATVGPRSRSTALAGSGRWPNGTARSKRRPTPSTPSTGVRQTSRANSPCLVRAAPFVGDPVDHRPGQRPRHHQQRPACHSDELGHLRHAPRRLFGGTYKRATRAAMTERSRPRTALAEWLDPHADEISGHGWLLCRISAVGTHRAAAHPRDRDRVVGLVDLVEHAVAASVSAA